MVWVESAGCGVVVRCDRTTMIRSSGVLGEHCYTSSGHHLQGILLGMIELRAVVIGKVQAVAYRAYAQEAATELELVGYVRNLPDGTVEVVAQGQADVLKEFVEYLHEGSLMAQVESVAVEWGSARKTFDEFSVLH